MLNRRIFIQQSAIGATGLTLSRLAIGSETSNKNISVKGGATRDIFYGEPVKLKGNYMYFTSWKYVRPGWVTWDMDWEHRATEVQKAQAEGLEGDLGGMVTYRNRGITRGIRLVAQESKKVPAEPGHFIAQVYDEGKYKTWYTVSPCHQSEPFSNKNKILPGHNFHLAYAESTDGIKWEEPHLGLYEYKGNKNNNLVFRGDVNGSIRGFHGGTVFVDPSSEKERYKMIYLGFCTDEEWATFARKYPGELDTRAWRGNRGKFSLRFGVFGAVSSNGFLWESLPEPLLIHHSDTENTCYYDLDLRKYVAYLRTWQADERVRMGEPDDESSWFASGRRVISRAESTDFRHFDKPRPCIVPGADMPPNHEWYKNCKTTLPGCPDNHVMFPWKYERECDGGDVWLLSSAQGEVWSVVPGGPVVRTGDTGSADGGYVDCSPHLLEYPDGTWGLPYGGSPIPHKYPGRDVELRKGLFPGITGVSGLAIWPKGRLVALQCDEEGEFSTVVVVPPTNKIRINAIVKPTGYIKISVREPGKSNDITGRSFEQCDRIVGDSLNFPVCWNGQDDIGSEGRPVRFRFEMRQAKLFGIEFC